MLPLTCESGFSALLQIKTKTRNRLGVEHDMRCALSTTVSKIYTLVLKKQAQPSHSYKTCADGGTTDFYCYIIFMVIKSVI